MRCRGKGVVREDPLEAAWQLPAAGAAAQQQGGLPGGSSCHASDSAVAPAACDTVGLILARLQQLPWRRIDVCYAASTLPFLSHAHIQVQWGLPEMPPFQAPLPAHAACKPAPAARLAETACIQALAQPQRCSPGPRR